MIERIADSNGWNQEVLRLGGGFLQSWEWGTFQEKAGMPVMRLRGEGVLAQLVRRSLPLGRSYWYCPRGPLGEGGVQALLASEEVRGADFLRVEPPEMPTGARKVRAVQPPRTLIVDLRQEPETLLAAMHEKWRYNIRLAERKGVRAYLAGAQDASAFGIFWGLMEETTARDDFHAHDKDYYRLMLETLSGDPATDGRTRPVARLLFAELDGKVLAANLMLYFGTKAIYLHGASSRERREVMAPQALHWQAMRDAKNWGYAAYDFWGIAPEDAPKHPWAGVTRFKRGFGGAPVDYPGTFDLPLNRFWYTLYRLARP